MDKKYTSSVNWDVNKDLKEIDPKELKYKWYKLGLDHDSVKAKRAYYAIRLVNEHPEEIKQIIEEHPSLIPYVSALLLKLLDNMNQESKLSAELKQRRYPWMELIIEKQNNLSASDIVKIIEVFRAWDRDTDKSDIIKKSLYLATGVVLAGAAVYFAKEYFSKKYEGSSFWEELNQSACNTNKNNNKYVYNSLSEEDKKNILK